jgi:hypothetical protein
MDLNLGNLSLNDFWNQNTYQFIGHLSYTLVALAFLLRDILLLRIVAITASACNITYAAGSDPVNLIAAFWQSVFIIINVSWSIRLIYERRSVRFSEEERDLYQSLFRSFTALEFMKLMRIGHWHQSEPEHVLTELGEEPNDVMLIYNGEIEAELPDGRNPRYRDGTFIGEISFIKGGPATATVRTVVPTRYVSWPKEELRKLLQRNPSMAATLQTVFTEDLTKKLIVPVPAAPPAVEPGQST